MCLPSCCFWTFAKAQRCPIYEITFLLKGVALNLFTTSHPSSFASTCLTRDKQVLQINILLCGKINMFKYAVITNSTSLWIS